MTDRARKRNSELAKASAAELRQRVEAVIGKPPAEGWKEPPPDPNRCPKCDSTGWVPAPDGRDAVVRCQDCLTRARGQAPGIPVDEHGSRLDNFTQLADNKAALAVAQQFLDGLHPDVYFFGGVGTGKTRLACSMLNELHARYQHVEFFRVPKLLTQLLPGEDSIDALIDRIAAIPVICLDDVGASQATDFARRMLLVIYEARGDRGTRTIWTSNLDLNELQEFTTDDRLPSRITGRAKTVEMDGKDWRLRKRR